MIGMIAKNQLATKIQYSIHIFMHVSSLERLVRMMTLVFYLIGCLRSFKIRTGKWEIRRSKLTPNIIGWK